jgi:outer membrane protein OmpA-like peptidoglycan-associated protein
MKKSNCIIFVRNVAILIFSGATMVACSFMEWQPQPVPITPLSEAQLKFLGVGTMTERGLRLDLDAVFFDVDKATLRQTGLRKLDEFVTSIQENGARIVYIEGHTDNTGDASYNQQLSEQRANTIREALIAKGIAAQRLVARGYGETQPKADNATKAGRQQNRRVEILISNDSVGSKMPIVSGGACNTHPFLSWRRCDSPPAERF